MKKITRIGIGGPVGSGKTAIIEVITPILINRGYKPLIITNDIVTTEDAKQVKRTLKGILDEDKILGVETGACPHTAVREDPSMNIAAVEEMEEMGNPIHVNTLAARDYLKGKTNEGKAGSGQQL